MLSASCARPLWDRVVEWNCRLEMIETARQFLYLSTFYIEYDRFGIEVLAALLRAQRRGVAVNLLIDGFGQTLGNVLMSAQDRQALATGLQQLKAAGATVTTYRPKHFMQRRLGGGQHVKLQVSEAGEAIFGSSNLTQSSFEGWNEYSVALRGPVVTALLQSYRRIGGTVHATHLRQLDDVAQSAAAKLPAIELEYWFCNPNLAQGAFGPLGWRGPNAVTERLREMLDGARETIELTSFYFKPIPALMDAVVAAAGRGVRVDVYHSHREALPATDLAWIASAVGYKQLLSSGVRIIENRHGEHSKIVLVDRARVAFGSYNFEDAAHDRLAEAMLASHDPRLVAPAISIFDGLQRDPDNVIVTPATVAALPTSLQRRLARYGRFKRWM
jgi:cardiolipin synthase